MQWHRVDWGKFLAWLPAWDRLAVPSRECFLGAEPTGPIPVEGLGDDLQWLVQGRFLFSPNGAGGAVPRPETARWLRVLRGLDHYPDLLDTGSFDSLRAYVQERFGVVRLRSLAPPLRCDDEPEAIIGRLGSHRRLRALLEAASLESWWRAEGGCSQLDWYQDEPTFLRVRDLARTLLEAGGALPMRELAGRFRVPGGCSLGEVVQAGLTGVLFLAALRPGDRLPMLTLYPPARRRLAKPRPQARAPVTPSQTFDSALGWIDLTSLLIEFSVDPPRLRRDGELFAKDARRLAEILEAPPGWIAPIMRYDRAAVLESIIGLGVELNLVRYGGGRRKMALEPTSRGRQWLRLPTRERFCRFVRQMRDRPGETLDLRRRPLDRWLWRGRPWHPVVRALEKALAEAPEKEFVLLSDFCRFLSRRHNPLADLDRRQRQQWGVPLSATADPDVARDTWERIVAGTLLRRLFPLGGVVLGLDGEGRVAFRLTSVGRFLLGYREDFQWELPEEQLDLVVQANFEVVFLAPSAPAEAELERFAERKGRGVGVLFALTRDSVFRAAAAGLTAPQALDTLERLSRNEVPANVQRQVSDWFASCRRVEARQTVLIRCPDEETARRVLSVGGRSVRLIAPDLVEVPDRKSVAKLKRRLAGQGIFLQW